jgi:hypothetical protein
MAEDVVGKVYDMDDEGDVATIPFNVVVRRRGAKETHSFLARPVQDIGSALAFASGDGSKMARAAVKLLARMLVDDDGVPSAWEFLALAADTANPFPSFAGPDGQRYPLGRAGEFTDVAAGSSRRRWNYLFYEDEDVTIRADVLVRIVQDMVEASAGIPTGASSS